MAIKNIFCRGIGFGAVGWVVTRGFGGVSDGGSSVSAGWGVVGVLGRFLRLGRRRAFL